jgi:CHAD domain-containing protein
MPIRLLPEGSDLASAREALAGHLELRAGRVRAGATTFYDSFDGRVRAAGLTVRHAGGRLLLERRDTGELLASAEAAAAPRLFAEDLPDGFDLTDALEMRALTPIARIRTRALPLAVLNRDLKTVVRLTVETHTLDETPLHGRVRATAVRGYERELEAVERILAETLGWPEATTTLVDEASAATGRDPAGTSAKLDRELDPALPATAAAAIVFERLLEIIADNLPGTLEDVDSEFLHDLRVAVRRTRSLQRQFRSVYPERLRHHRDEFKRLQAITSDLRDLDVYLLDFPDLRASLPPQLQPDLDPLLPLLETRRARALRETRRGLKAKRTQDELDTWATFTVDVAPSEVTVQALASERISKVYKKMLRMGGSIDDDSPAADLHELRKVGKELRYLLEFFQSLYAPEVVKPFIKTLKGLQDQLGRFQDREVQATALRNLAPDVDSPPTVMAMGVLVDRFIKEEAQARTEFADRFASFASREQRALVKEHFA